MKVCPVEKQEAQVPKLIEGHIYQHRTHLYIYNYYKNILVRLNDGIVWNDGEGWGKSTEGWSDVTDQYCVQRIKE